MVFAPSLLSLGSVASRTRLGDYLLCIEELLLSVFETAKSLLLSVASDHISKGTDTVLLGAACDTISTVRTLDFLRSFSPEVELLPVSLL